jgi:hypothetical protein
MAGENIHKYTYISLEISHMSDLDIVHIFRADICHIFLHLPRYMICNSRGTAHLSVLRCHTELRVYLRSTSRSLVECKGEEEADRS